MARTTMTAAMCAIWPFLVWYKKVCCLGPSNPLYDIIIRTYISFHTIRLQVFSLSQVTIGRLSIGHIVKLTTMMFSGLSTYIRRYRIVISLIQTVVLQCNTVLIAPLHCIPLYVTLYFYFFRHLSIHTFSIAPVHLVVTLYLIYLELGCSSFVIMVFILLQIPMPISLAKLFSIYRYSSGVCSNW